MQTFFNHFKVNSVYGFVFFYVGASFFFVFCFCVLFSTFNFVFDELLFRVLFIHGGMSTLIPSNVNIRNVWQKNLDEEFANIRKLVNDYTFIAFDTEFPGVVATPMGAYRNKEEFQYHQITCNVNGLKLIQVGFCLMNEKGELPPGGDIWQFNFQFNITSDWYAVESVDLLKKSGLDFERHRVSF